MKKIILGILLGSIQLVVAQSYAPPVGQHGTTAIHKDSSVFIGWATGIEVVRGFVRVDNQTVEYNGTNLASFGEPDWALGKPEGTTTKAVSLGDGGMATVTFDLLITDGEGWDFAVFENGVTDDFLELAFVEVSSDGEHFFRFPSHSEVQYTTQVGGFDPTDCRYINNLAGKYRLNYGTPFDLSDLPDTSLLDKNAVRYVRMIDVVGSINPDYASYDSFGNIINDPFPTPFHSGGFDLTGIGIIHGVEDSEGPDLQVISPTTLTVKVYPTIADEIIFVEAEADFSYEIIDLKGRKVLIGAGVSGKNSLDVSSLVKGIFFLNVFNQQGRSIVRIFK